MNSIKVRVFCMTVGWVLFCTVLSACGGSPAPVSAQPPAGEIDAPMLVPVSTQSAGPADELDSAIRAASDYLNQRLPKGNKLVVLNVQSEFPALSEYIIDELIANTVNDRVFSVVDRQQLNTIRAELEFQMSGEVDDDTAQALGRMAGAQIIISGAVSQIGDLYRLRVRALSVQSAQIEGQFNRNIPDGPTIAALVRSNATGYGTASGGSAAPIRGTATSSGRSAPAPIAPADPNVYRGNGHRYEVINQSMTWIDADAEAKRRGGHLATIVDSAEQAFIENLIARNGSRNLYWLGGYRSGNRWNWVDNTPFTYTNWAPTEPNGKEIDDRLTILRVTSPFMARPGQWDDGYNNMNTIRDNNNYWRDLGFIIEWDGNVERPLAQTPAVEMAQPSVPVPVAPTDPNVYRENGHRYEVINQSMTWIDADAEAGRRGGYLATIADSGEQAFIENLLARNGSRNLYWLGGYRSGNQWNWVDGTPFTYTNWGAGCPDNAGGREDKLNILRVLNNRIIPGKWNDGPNNENTSGDNYWRDLGFIIEWDGNAAARATSAALAATPAPEKVYKIGDTGPAGGFVFYDKGYFLDGWQYLEAASRDVGIGIPWSVSMRIVNGTSTIVGTGKRNTELIVGSGENISAALEASHYSQGGYNDWYLPSKDELNFMYRNLKQRNLGSLSNGWYWSSSDAYTPTSDNDGWSQLFSNGQLNGSHNGDNKNATNTSVRPIRQF